MYITNTALLLEKTAGARPVLCAFNAYNPDMALAIMEEAAAWQKPVIVQVTPATLDLYRWHPLVAFVRAAAGLFDIPVALHLDHAKKADEAMRAAAMGFSSVMYDGSRLPYRDNAANTAELVRYGHGLGIAVEGEIGHVGADDGDVARLTDPEEAAAFVRDTGVDLLAVAIGNVHGIPARDPDVDPDRAGRIAAAAGVPLVLHGASGLPPEVLRSCVTRGGMAKINFATDLKNAWLSACERRGGDGVADPRRLAAAGGAAVRAMVRAKMADVGG